VIRPVTAPTAPPTARAKGRTVTTGSGSPYCSPTSRADETAAHKALHRIVRVGASR